MPFNVDRSEGLVISVTELGVFKRCRRLWDYKYQQDLVPVREAPYLFVGRLVHQCLEQWSTEPEREVESVWADVLKQEIGFYKERYQAVVGTLPGESEVDAMLESAHMPFSMLQNYVAYWKRPLPAGYRVIQLEQTCLVDIPGVDAKLEGTLDGLVADEKNRLYVLERKTYGARPALETLENNEQFVGYSWMLRTLFPEHEIGGVLYDGLWKREAPPKGRVMADLFFRHLLDKTEEEIENWGEQLVEVAKDIAEGPRIYPNRTWIGCFDDKDYEPLCEAQSKGYDYDAIRSVNYGNRQDARWPITEEAE